jgi:CO/xanthine dehydrogenase FAD-binding subunit
MSLHILHPATPAEAVAAHRDPDTAFVAGGTALQLSWRNPAPALTLIDVLALEAAQGIALQADGSLRIGAAVSLEAVRTHAAVAARAPLLATACDSLAALAVRHLATLGGNLGWRFGDTVAALLAHQAEAELADGRRQPLPELLAHDRLPLVLALHLPPPNPDEHRFYEKVGHRAAFTPARIALAVSACIANDGRLHNTRIGLAGAGLSGRRLRYAEAWLNACQPARLGPTDSGLRAAVATDLPADPASARLAARILGGRLGRLHAGGAASEPATSS